MKYSRSLTTSVGLVAVNVSMQHCVEGGYDERRPLLATSDCGRLGNLLGQYAVLLALSLKSPFEPVLILKHARHLSRFFREVPVKAVKVYCLRHLKESSVHEVDRALRDGDLSEILYGFKGIVITGCVHDIRQERKLRTAFDNSFAFKVLPSAYGRNQASV